MVLNQTFEKDVWLGAKKGQTWKAFNFCRKSSTSRPCSNECSHLGKCHGYVKEKLSKGC
jgi:hypothetical protein